MSKRFLLDGRHLRQGLSLLMALVLVGSVSYLGERFYNSSHAATGASMSLSPSSQTVTSGATVSVTIRENSGTEPVNAAQASLTYNANQLSYVSMSSGDFPFDAADSTTQAGVVRVARAIQTGTLTGDRAVATINFHVKATSGSTALAIDQSSSDVNRSSDGSNILAAVSGATYTIGTSPTPTPTPTQTPTPTPTPTQGSSNPTLSLLPSSGSYAKGSIINVAVHVLSSSKKITVAEPVIQYPTNQLSFVKTVNNTGVFPTVLPDSNSNGTLDITRGISGGAAGVTGDNVVVTVQFKVIGSSGNIALKLAGNSSVYDDSGNGRSVLDLADSRTATYSIASGQTGSPTPAPVQSGSGGGGSATTASSDQTATVVTHSGAVVRSQDNSGSVSQNGNSTQVQGSVDLAPALDVSNTATAGSSVVKVEYYLNNKLLDTETKSPYTYKLDTKKFKNGTYTMTIKTYYENGTVDSSSDSIIVHNPVTIGYIMAHYTTPIAGSVLALLILAVVFWRFLLPRFRGGSGGDGGYGGYAGYATTPPTDPGAPTAPDPAVIMPTTGYESGEVTAAQTQGVITPGIQQPAAPQAIDPTAVPAPQPYQLPQTPQYPSDDQTVRPAPPQAPQGPVQ